MIGIAGPGGAVSAVGLTAMAIDIVGPPGMPCGPGKVQEKA